MKIVTTRAVLFVLAVAVFLTLALPNLYVAARSTDRPPLANAALQPADYHFAHKFLVRAGIGAVVLFALVLAAHPASQWESVLLFLNRVPFGETDPIFGRDFSFLIFTLPAVRLVHGWLIAAVTSVGLIVLAFHYLTGRLRGEARFWEGARVQLAVLVAVMFLLIAAGHWLGRYELLYSPTGAVFGVGYTDDHVNLPGRALLTVVAVATAGFVLVGGVFSKRYRWVVGPVAIWFVLLILVGSLAPWLVQRLRVEPAELALERDYLANNIEFHAQRLRTGGSGVAQPSGARRHRGPDGRRQPRDAAQRAALGRGPAAAELQSDPVLPPLLRLPGGPHRPLHGGRRAAAGDARHARAVGG